jgi:predicted O-methyltransferase YrrM
MTRGGSSIPEVQKLLRVLAAGRRCAEAGTAFGEGTRAMAESADHVVSVEIDRDRARTVAESLIELKNVELLEGDWREELPSRGPFGLIFLDAGGFKESPEEVGAIALSLLEKGGLMIADDMVPGLAAHDRARSFILNHPILVGVEVLTTPESSALIAACR